MPAALQSFLRDATGPARFFYLLLAVMLAAAAVFLVLLLIACLRALFTRARPGATAPPACDAAEADRQARHLARLIRCETYFDPAAPEGASAPAFARLNDELRRMYPLTFERLEEITLPDALLLRWPGQGPAAGRDMGAVLLMAHCDVVPAPGQWQHPPFSGSIENGTVWGRGAMDNKGALCAIFEAVEGLLAQGFSPACDVYLCSSHNEERMGPGAVHVHDWLKENGVRLDIVLDEGGAVTGLPLPGIPGNFALLGLGEKGYANLRFTAQSAGGHASTPPKNSPLARLAAFITRAEKRPPFKVAICPPVRQFFEGLAPHAPFRWRLLLGNLWLFAPLVKWLLPRASAQGTALMRTTIAFTMAQGSDTANVIPQSASVTANMRFAPHQPMQPSLAAIEKLAGHYKLSMEVLYVNDVFPMVDTGGEAYRFLKSCAEAAFPEAPAIPYIMLAGTDSRHFAAECPCTLRFLPLMLSRRQMAAMHGVDENLDAAALARATAYYTLLLRGWRAPGN